MLLKPSLPERAWETYVPIVKTRKGYTAYLTDNIADVSEYNELCFILSQAQSDEEVTLIINNHGGMIDSALMIRAAIQSSQATVIAHLSGTVASAATIIALSCDVLEAEPHMSFMIHNYSSGAHGKGHEMKARQEFIDQELNSAFRTFYNGFLTDDEMTSVIDGKDLWLNTEDTMKRWEQTHKGDM